MGMFIDNFVADETMLPQGKGQDHTLWSWNQITEGGASKIEFFEDKAEEASDKVAKFEDLLETFWEDVTPPTIGAELSCELNRREEMNLYYQCTQNGYNNYSLDHFGGEMRSYPRWIWEFKRCNVILAKAECCTVEYMGEEKDCPPCTDITLPMPEPFGDRVVVIPDEDHGIHISIDVDVTVEKTTTTA